MTTKLEAPTPFDFDSCYATLVRACAEVKLNPEVIELIRIGENAIFHLAREGMVARIARGMDRLGDAEKELRVARWLVVEGVGTAAPIDLPQPVVADGRPVTFWRHIPHELDYSTLSELGEVLRSLHGLNPPTSLKLPAHDMFGRVADRIERATEIPQSDLDFMRELYDELRAKFEGLSFQLEPCAVHGDAHVGNVLREVGDGLALIDLERVSFGQPELDLATPATEHRIGWFSSDEYRQFAQSYGFDVLEWSGFPVVQAINELKMTTWLMQNVGHSRETDQEIRRRIDSLKDSSKRRCWQPF